MMKKAATGPPDRFAGPRLVVLYQYDAGVVGLVELFVELHQGRVIGIWKAAGESFIAPEVDDLVRLDFCRDVVSPEFIVDMDVLGYGLRGITGGDADHDTVYVLVSFFIDEIVFPDRIRGKAGRGLVE